MFATLKVPHKAHYYLMSLSQQPRDTYYYDLCYMRKVRFKGVRYVAEGHIVVGMEPHSIAGGPSVLGKNGREHMCQVKGEFLISLLLLTLISHTFWGRYYYCVHFADEGTKVLVSYPAQDSHASRWMLRCRTMVIVPVLIPQNNTICHQTIFITYK